MKEKKNSPDWYIAAAHLLTAGFVIPFLIGIGLAILAYFWVSFSHILLSPLQVLIAILIIYPAMMFFGAKYSASYINNYYIIKSNIQVVNLSTVYLIILGVLYKVNIFSKGMSVEIFLNLLAFTLGVAVFYFTSKQYIKNNFTS